MFEKDINDRFWNKVNKHTDNGCWEWQGNYNHGGYGVFWIDGQNRMAHRIVFKMLNMIEPTSDIMVCHHCDNPKCVLPNHLFFGTAKDNALDMVAKGRDANGIEKIRKYDDATIEYIRASDKKQTEIAQELNMKQYEISRIRSGKRYATLSKDLPWAE